MTYDDLIQHFGTQLKAAKALGIKQPSISLWKERGQIPYLRQMHIQLVTGGMLQADKDTRHVAAPAAGNSKEKAPVDQTGAGYNHQRKEV